MGGEGGPGGVFGADAFGPVDEVGDGAHADRRECLGEAGGGGGAEGGVKFGQLGFLVDQLRVGQRVFRGVLDRQADT